MLDFTLPSWLFVGEPRDRSAEVLAIFDQEVISDEVQRSNEVTTGPSR